MTSHRPPPPASGPLALLGLAILVAVAAWGIPGRLRGIHPVALAAAAHGRPSTVVAAEAMVAAGKPGPAAWIAAAAVEAGLAGTNTLAAKVSAALARPEARAWGGPPPPGAPAFPAPPGTQATSATSAIPAADLFLSPEARRAWRQRTESSRSPGAVATWQARSFAPRRFVAVDRPGGQPLESMMLLLAALHEQGTLSDGLGAGLRSLAAQAAPGRPSEGLEQACLDLLVLARRLDWTTLGELLRVMPDTLSLREWTAAAQRDGSALPRLLATSVLSGRPDAMVSRMAGPPAAGRDGLVAALQGGEGAARWLGRARGPLVTGAWGWPWLGGWAAREPGLAGGTRMALLLLAAALAGLGTAGVMGTSFEDLPGLVRRGSALTFVAAALLILPAEPWAMPGAAPRVEARLVASAVAHDPAQAKPGTRWKMESSTLGTIAVFGALQAVVYGVCRRKIAEILSMQEPAAMRLRLLENEENLFDSGLYLGIAGTATALVLQVLHLVEANLLAAYSSNLMGIVTVALVKIVHLRQARRGLIIESKPAPSA